MVWWHTTQLRVCKKISNNNELMGPISFPLPLLQYLPKPTLFFFFPFFKLKKTASDDSLIDALREEIAQNRNAMATMTRQIHTLRANEHGEDTQYAALKSMTQDQAQQMKRQEQIVLSLRAELNQLTNNASTDMVVKAQKDIALHDKNTDLSLLKVESNKT